MKNSLIHAVFLLPAASVYVVGGIMGSLALMAVAEAGFWFWLIQKRRTSLA